MPVKKTGQGSFLLFEKNCWIACYIRILLDMNMRVHRFANNDINQVGCVKLKVRMEKMCGGLRPSVSEKSFLQSACQILQYILSEFGCRSSLRQPNSGEISHKLWRTSCRKPFPNTLWSDDISNGMKYVINVGYFICLNFYMHCLFENEF